MQTNDVSNFYCNTKDNNSTGGNEKRAVYYYPSRHRAKCLPGGVLVAGLLLVVKLEVLATLEDVLDDSLAGGALHLEDDLLGGLGLLVEDGLGLATVTGLLLVVTALALGEEASLTSLVLDDLEGLVGLAPLVGAVHLLLLGEVHHFDLTFL